MSGRVGVRIGRTAGTNDADAILTQLVCAISPPIFKPKFATRTTMRAPNPHSANIDEECQLQPTDTGYKIHAASSPTTYKIQSTYPRG